MSEKKRKRIPKVRIVQPAGRPIQLRYFDPDAGREVRISTGTYDRSEADEDRKDLEAKLRLGEKPAPKATKQHGPRMSWEMFRDEYRENHLRIWLRGRSADSAESRLDIAERIIKPRTLADMASRTELMRLQRELLAGKEGRKHGEEGIVRQRSKHTVKGYMAAVLAALGWACEQEWIEFVPKLKKISTAKIRAAKGRPITRAEFDRMLETVETTVGAAAAPSWKYLLRGLWASGLRLSELMALSWDDPTKIRPMFSAGMVPVLSIPAAMQKNNTEETVPMLADFENLLLETPLEDRTGWVFRPASLQEKCGRKRRHGRPKADWVGKIVSRIGETAGVVVHPGDVATSRPAKYASAHDLRRSFGDRLVSAGVPATVATRLMRHASFDTTQRHYATGDVQTDGRIARERLAAVPRYNLEPESSQV